jgi:hypothetical protein
MLKLAAVIGQEPGIRRDELYAAFGEQFPDDPASPSTLNNAVRALKDVGLLSDRAQRSGYYLTAHAIDPHEQEAILVALRLHGVDLGNPHAQRILDDLLERLPRSSESREDLAYPVEAITQRRVVDTRAADIARFMEALRSPIRRGWPLELTEVKDHYSLVHDPKVHVVYPLQLLFHNVAWYVLVEYVKPVDARFHVLRVDRLAHDVVQAKGPPVRGMKRQREGLGRARAMMAYGWDAAIPDSVEPHRLDRVKVRFRREVVPFLDEVRDDFRAFADVPDAEREATRIVRRMDGDALVLELTLAAHPGVRNEFQRWLATWGAMAEALEPAWLRRAMHDRHTSAAQVYAADGV